MKSGIMGVIYNLKGRIISRSLSDYSTLNIFTGPDKLRNSPCNTKLIHTGKNDFYNKNKSKCQAYLMSELFKTTAIDVYKFKLYVYIT